MFCRFFFFSLFYVCFRMRLDVAHNSTKEKKIQLRRSKILHTTQNKISTLRDWSSEWNRIVFPYLLKNRKYLLNFVVILRYIFSFMFSSSPSTPIILFDSSFYHNVLLIFFYIILLRIKPSNIIIYTKH